MDIEITLTPNNLGIQFTGMKEDLDNFVEIIYHILPFDNNYEEEDIRYLLGLTHDLSHPDIKKGLATAQIILPTLLLQLAILAKYRNQFENELGQELDEYDNQVIETLKGLESVVFESIQNESLDGYDAAIKWLERFEYDAQTYLFSIADHFIAKQYIECKVDQRMAELDNMLSSILPTHEHYQIFAESLKKSAITDKVNIFELKFENSEIYEKVGTTKEFAW